MAIAAYNFWYTGLESYGNESATFTDSQQQELVIYRTRAGLVNAVEAFCPHLGAHLAHGGAVVGDDIRCPFHGFQFAPDGECTATGYGTKPPRKARLTLIPVREIHGIVLAYYDSQQAQPVWEPPSCPVGRFRYWARQFYTDPPLIQADPLSDAAD